MKRVFGQWNHCMSYYFQHFNCYKHPGIFKDPGFFNSKPKEFIRNSTQNLVSRGHTLDIIVDQ